MNREYREELTTKQIDVINQRIASKQRQISLINRADRLSREEKGRISDLRAEIRWLQSQLYKPVVKKEREQISPTVEETVERIKQVFGRKQ